MSFDTFDTDSVATAGVTFSNGNLTALGAAGTSLVSSAFVQSLEGKIAGKWYVEFTCVAISGNVDGVGITSSVGPISGSGFIGSDVASWGYFTNSNIVFTAVAQTAVNNTTWTVGDVIGIAIDIDDATLWFRKNTGAWIGTSGTPNPATNTGGFSLMQALSGGARIFPAVNLSGSTAKFTANFGATTFTGAVPSGFTSGWTNTTAGTYFGSFANTGHNGASVQAPPTGDKAVASYTATVTGPVASVVFAFGTGSVTIKAVIYADSAGAPGALLGVSGSVAVSVRGEYAFLFSGVNVVSGTQYWIGMVSAGTQLIQSPPLTNGIAFNTANTFASPSNPFGAPTTANFRYPAIINLGAKSARPVTFVVT